MASLDLDENRAQNQIRAYQPGTIKVNEISYTASLVISPTELIPDWRPQSAETITEDDLSLLANLKPDVVLIGTGSNLIFLPPSLYSVLINQGIGVEIMNTGAACRTFNALSAENRRVVAALIIQ